MILTRQKRANGTRLPPVKAIREYCKTVCAESPKEIRLCTTPTCPLYPYRMGKNPARAGVGVGRRGPEGFFLAGPTRSTGGIMQGKDSGGMDWGSATSIVPGANGKKSRTSEVEVSNGEVRIRKTAYGLTIKLTQARQNKPGLTHEA